MRAYLAFTKKELIEYTRNFKMFLAITLFALLGIMNPLTAKFMPELLGNFMPEGISIPGSNSSRTAPRLVCSSSSSF